MIFKSCLSADFGHAEKRQGAKIELNYSKKIGNTDF